MKKKRQSRSKVFIHIDYGCMKIYDDIFGTTGGFYFLEPDGMLAYDPITKKNYFCLREDKIIFLDRCQRSQECGKNLFAEEWEEWKGDAEGMKNLDL